MFSRTYLGYSIYSIYLGYSIYLRYSIILYIGDTPSRYSALSAWELLVSLMQSVRDVKFFQCYLFFSFVCFFYCGICSYSSNCYVSLDNYVIIATVTEAWLHRHGIESDLTVLYFPQAPSNTSIQFFVQRFNGWSLVLSSNMVFLWYSILSLYI